LSIEDDIAFLGRVPTFAKFGYAALQIIAIGSETRHLVDGETLFRAGETTDAGYVIQEGSLQLTTHDPRLTEPTITFGPGTLIGELALLTETVCSATATAPEPTTVIRISRNLFRKVLEGFPEPARLMRDRFAVRADQASTELVRIRALLEKLGQKGGSAAVRSPPLPGRARGT
jgi:CRP-like cAMP-binding protein